ncbi:hypothetical protein ACRALDRAFT_2023411 [Sodiomyces alcalophilus JCM 7366]|uniref:uncharacterized protein n=1 Tax=Sodiomyces alcalophilus JCM 7366 TaxID=591952 RepID=UPI0039B4A838
MYRAGLTDAPSTQLPNEIRLSNRPSSGFPPTGWSRHLIRRQKISTSLPQLASRTSNRVIHPSPSSVVCLTPLILLAMGSTPTSPPPLAFREATPADVPLLLPLIRTAYRTAAGWTNEAAFLNDKRISPEALAAKIARPDGVVLIATNSDTAALVACCEVQVSQPDPSRPADGRPAYFGLFAVDPALQANGVGRRVLARAEEYARERWRATRMDMFVIWLRTELIDWYLRRGYVRTGETAPFPYAEVYEGKALRDDLYFDVLRKEFGEVNGQPTS